MLLAERLGERGALGTPLHVAGNGRAAREISVRKEDRHIVEICKPASTRALSAREWMIGSWRGAGGEQAGAVTVSEHAKW